MNKQPLLHVVFGSGPLGRATAETLRDRGRVVRLVNRSGLVADPIPGVALHAADLLDRAAARRAVHGAEAVYFCAQPPYHRWPELFPALQSAAIDAVAEIGARFIVAENLYGYGPVHGPLREDLPLEPSTSKGRVRASMHTTLMEAHGAGRLPVAVARGSDFFGPHVKGSVVGSRAMRAILGGRKVEVFGCLDVPHCYTFVRDFAVALAILGDDPRSLGNVWHVPNAPATTTRTFLETAFHLAEKPVRLKTMSNWEMRLVGLFIPAVRESIEMLYEFQRPFIVDHRKFANTFGNIATSLDTALHETIEWTRRKSGV